MGRQTRKAINFDLNTKIVEANMTAKQISGTASKAYYDIKKFLSENGYEGAQESAYTSKKPTTFQKANELITEMVEEIPYLKGAVKSMHLTSVGGTHNVTRIIMEQPEIEVEKPESIHKLEKKYEIEVDNKKDKRKLIRFDLSGDELEKKFEDEEIDSDITIAYNWMEKCLTSLGYSREQRSVYISNNKKSDLELLEDLSKISKELPLVSKCFSSFEVTTIGRRHNVISVVDSGLEEVEKNAIKKEELEEEQKKDNGFEL